MRIYKTFLVLGFVLTGVFCLGNTSWGQVVDDDSATIRITQEAIDSGKPIYIDQWKYHPGDNPAWAAPEFDDSEWETVDSKLLPKNLPESGWEGIGWFRANLLVETVLTNRSLALLIAQFGASEIYLNGKKLFSVGVVSADPQNETPYLIYFPNPPIHTVYPSLPKAKEINFSHSDNILAVRYSNNKYSILHANWYPTGFKLGLQNFESWNTDHTALLQHITYNNTIFLSIHFIMALLTLTVFIYYPKLTEYLYFFIFITLAGSGTFFRYQHIFYTHTIDHFLLFEWAAFFCFSIHPFFALLFIYKCFGIRNYKIPFAVAIAGILQILARSYVYTAPIFWFFMIIEYSRCIYLGIRNKITAGIGFIIFGLICAIIGLFMFIFASIFFPEKHNFMLNTIYGHFFMLFNISIALYLAFRLSFVQKNLELLNVDLERRVAQRTEELEKANEELRELDHMKTAFVSQASHDLRTPLTAIKGSLDNLKLGIAGELNEKQQRILERASKSVDRLGHLVNDVLDMARIESGRIVLDKADVPFKSMVENILAEEKPAADKKNISLTFNADSEPTVHIDHGKMERVVGELISNAIKYTPEGGTVEVNLKSEGKSQEGEAPAEPHVVLTVKDSGIGMSKDDLQKIWDRFYRTTASKKFAKGSGLGLSIAKELVEMHGGSISVESEEGKGTCFTLRLPLS